MIKETKFFDFSIYIQMILLEKSIKAGYGIQRIIESMHIEPPQSGRRYGVWKIKTGDFEGFSLNISEKELAESLDKYLGKTFI